eukprot:scaffold48_cov311-Pinguiococcus_pyrenoidosus.AAC.188
MQSRGSKDSIAGRFLACRTLRLVRSKKTHLLTSLDARDPAAASTAFGAALLVLAAGREVGITLRRVECVQSLA